MSRDLALRGVAGNEMRNFLLATVVFFGGVTACKETSFMGRTKTAPYIPPPVPTPTPVYLSLNVRKMRPDAWWRTCMYVTLNGAEKAVWSGCSKGDGATAADEVIRIEANPKACNILRFYMNVHQNPVGTKCESGKTCETEAQPTCQRVSARAADRDFFVFVDALQLDPKRSSLPSKVRLTDVDVVARNQTLYETAAKNPTGAKYYRMFFEDQSNSNLRRFESESRGKDSAGRLKVADMTGIDFNDFVFDVESENVAVAIDGFMQDGNGSWAKIPCALPPPPDFVPYVETPQAQGCEVSNLQVGNKPSASPGVVGSPAK
jgi:hypothetical protein